MNRNWEKVETAIDTLKAQLEDIISQLDKLKADQVDPVETVNMVPSEYTPEEWERIKNSEPVQIAPTFHPDSWGNPTPDLPSPPGSAPRPGIGGGLKP